MSAPFVLTMSDSLGFEMGNQWRTKANEIHPTMDDVWRSFWQIEKRLQPLLRALHG